MLVQNSGDILKARSNHWFFAYIPDALVPESNSAVVGLPTITSTNGRCACYGGYLTFLGFGLLALYTQIALVHPTSMAWQATTLEAFGWEHSAARSRHERLAREFHIKAQSDTIDGIKARLKAAHAQEESLRDARNATQALQAALTDRQEAQMEQQQAKELAQEATEEHNLYLEYLQNASLHEERAQELQKQAEDWAKQSEQYHHIFDQFSFQAQEDETLAQAYLQNSTFEGQVSQNITTEVQDHQDRMWVCKWGWSRKYVCGVLGGYTALGEARKWHQKETEDYEKAMDLEQQVQTEQAKAMIASTQAARTKEEARLSRLQAEKYINATVLEEIRAAEARAKELRDLQKELQDLRLAHEHLHGLEHYQALQVQMETQSRKEVEYSHGEWELGTGLLDKAGEEQGESDREWDLAKAEEAKQRELVERGNKLGQRLRLFSAAAAAFALISLAFFVAAFFTTNTVSLGYQLKTLATAVSVTVSREGRHTYWEGRSILGDHQDRFCLRQLSCWFHHGICFLVVAGTKGEQLSCIFANESLSMRGDLLLKFALAAGLLEALLFQAVPHAAVLPALTREYFRNGAARFVFSTSRFALQMMLLLILSGQDSTWLFAWIMALHGHYIRWMLLLMFTTSAHMFFIEFPHALSLDRNDGSGLSDVTFATYTTLGESTSSQDCKKASLIKQHTHRVDLESQPVGQVTITNLPHRSVANNETESLLTVSRAQAPSFGFLLYSEMLSMRSTLAAETASNPIFFPSPALQRCYEVSIQDELFSILSYVEILLLTGVLLVICASLPNIAHH